MKMILSLRKRLPQIIAMLLSIMMLAGLCGTALASEQESTIEFDVQRGADDQPVFTWGDDVPVTINTSGDKSINDLFGAVMKDISTFTPRSFLINLQNNANEPVQFHLIAAPIVDYFIDDPAAPSPRPVTAATDLLDKYNDIMREEVGSGWVDKKLNNDLLNYIWIRIDWINAPPDTNSRVLTERRLIDHGVPLTQDSGPLNTHSSLPIATVNPGASGTVRVTITVVPPCTDRGLDDVVAAYPNCDTRPCEHTTEDFYSFNDYNNGFVAVNWMFRAVGPGVVPTQPGDGDDRPPTDEIIIIPEPTPPLDPGPDEEDVIIIVVDPPLDEMPQTGGITTYTVLAAGALIFFMTLLMITFRRRKKPQEK